MIDEIDDFMVEHPIFITSPNQLITNHILRAEALKLAFRDMTHGQTNTHFETVMLKLNSYIINAKEQIRAQQEISNLRNLMEQTQDQRELISLLEQIDQLQTNQSNVSAFQSHPLQMCKTTPIPKIEFNEDILSQQLQLELSGGRTGKRFVGFDLFFVGLSVKSSEFVGLSVKRKHCGVGD